MTDYEKDELIKYLCSAINRTRCDFYWLSGFTAAEGGFERSLDAGAGAAEAKVASGGGFL